MATVLPIARANESRDELVEALNGLAVGLVPLEAVRALATRVSADTEGAARAQTVIDEAYDDGRLAAADYATLCVDLGADADEDLPTDWSDSPLVKAMPQPRGTVAAPTADEPAAAKPEAPAAVAVTPAPAPIPASTPAPTPAPPKATVAKTSGATNHAPPISLEAAPSSVTPTAAAKSAKTAPPAQGASLDTGSVLRDRYVLEERVGTTNHSTIFRALDRRREEAGADERHLALKIVDKQESHYESAVRLLQQEAALAHKLEHEHIRRVLDFDRDGDRAFLTMEWLEGESLAELLNRDRNKPLSLALAARVVSEIGAALSYAHARGVAHADVKPGNIFLTRAGVAKLLDFGTARAASDPRAATPAEARTPAYASCEVLEGQPPTAADDVYSLAAVAFRMLAGRRIFGHHDALAAERAGRHVTAVPGLDERRAKALMRALALRRAERTPDIATFLREFSAPTAAAPPPWVTTGASADAGLRVSADRRPLWAGIAIAVLAIGATLFFRDGEPPATAAAPAVVPPAPATARQSATPQSASTGGASAAVGQIERATPAAAVPPPPAEPAPASASTRAPLAAPPAAARPARTAPTPTRVAMATPSRAVPGAAPSGQTARSPAEMGPPRPTGSTATTAGGPQQVPLTSLTFRRYVEPTVRESARKGASDDGWVELQFVVGTNGEPRAIQVIDASPPGTFDASAIAAVKRWRFAPPQEAGKIVERRTSVRLRFKPEE